MSTGSREERYCGLLESSERSIAHEPVGMNPLRDNQLEAFVAFAEHLNFGKAADELHMAQPALHARIRKLQKNLGATLYVSERQRVTRLTAEGRALLEYAQTAQRMADDAYASIRGAHVGPLRIAAGNGAYVYVLPAAIENLTRRDGGISTTHASNDEAIDLVRSGACDVGVIAQIAVPSDLLSRDLATYPQILVVAESHRLATDESISINELDGLSMVLPAIDQSHRQWLEEAFASREVAVTVEAEALSWDLLVKFVEFGIEATVVNGFYPLPEGLVGVPISDAPPITYRLIFRRARYELGIEMFEAFEAGTGR